MTTRRRLTERQVLLVLLAQGAIVPCYRCRRALRPEDVPTVEREHKHEIALGGPDTLDNAAYSHGQCHAEITDGTPATTAGSSKHRIAKAKRLAKGPKQSRHKIRSRGFDKTRTRKFSGKVVPRNPRKGNDDGDV